MPSINGALFSILYHSSSVVAGAQPKAGSGAGFIEILFSFSDLHDIRMKTEIASVQNNFITVKDWFL